MARHGYRIRIKRWWMLVIGLIAGCVALLSQPWSFGTWVSHPHPARTYAEALEQIDLLRAQEAAPVNPVCRLQLFTHHRTVERAIVLVHGYTSCPEQFRALGEQFYGLGYNVLIAPLPHHGLADRMNDAQGGLYAEELVTYADAVVDSAQGLGTHVTMLGFSIGGTTTAWAAQYRDDLDQAVIVSPAFGFQPIPTPLTALVMNVVRLLPDAYSWWDPVVQDQGDGEGIYAYPRYSRHVLAQTLRLGFAVQAAAEQRAPATHAIIVVTNLNEPSVNNDRTQQVVSAWQDHGAVITTATFAADLHLGHDLIDPSQPDQQIDVVYPHLIALVTNRTN